MGPLRGRSVQSGIEDVTTALAHLGSNSGKATTKQTPAPELTVSQPISRKVVEWDEYTGRFDAVESVDVRARVSGYLMNVKF
ncbi:hypothetical protein MXD81_21900, partial [Microbacteriaceae bacterium K1510]|nr:hypothetical protein [Microbacteriaceae bacterium K1510]